MVVVKSSPAATRASTDGGPVDLRDLPLSYLAQFVGAAANERVVRDLEAEGHGAQRSSHGYVVQHLLAGPRNASEVAKLLGVTQQAASKTMLEMERAGYLRQVADPDARVRRVELTERARESVAAARASRARLETELRKLLGKVAFEATRASLVRVVERLGMAEDVRQRRVRPPR